MSDAPLSPEEMDAIQDAMRESRSMPQRQASYSDDEVGPLALIADDRQAETARPVGLRLGERWARTAHRQLRHQISGEYQINVASAEVIDGEPTRDELRATWLASVTPADGRGSALVAAGGPMIEAVAARLCGGQAEEEAADRPPSTTALRIFEPVGQTIASALVSAWSDEQACMVAASSREVHVERTRRAIQEADVVVSVTLELTGAVKGRIRLLAHPGTLVPPPAPARAVPASRGQIEAALGRVPVELRVDLGRTSVTMAELGRLQVGTVITLTNFVDDPLPVRCGDVVKAFGRPVVSRGVLAVEIDRPADNQGEKAA